MSEEGTFWIQAWKIVGLVVVVLMATVASCSAHRSYLVSELGKQTGDPIAARCAIDRSEYDGALCAIKAMSEGER